MTAITVEQLKAITRCSDSAASVWLVPLIDAMDRWGISTDRQRAAFLAQIAHESGRLTRFEENLNYSAQGLANTWPRRFALDPTATVKQPSPLAMRLHRQPQLIANHAYADRMGNGSVESGDGWTYRGRGPKQITGKANYRLYARASRNPNLLNEPDALLIPMVGADAAGWYWHDAGCSEMINRDDFQACTLAINGGLIGQPERVALYEQAKQILQCT